MTFFVPDFMSAVHSPNNVVLLENNPSCIPVINSIAEREN